MKLYDDIHGLALVIDDALIDAISEQAISSYPNETGGFLVGKYSDNCREAFVNGIIIPPRIKSGPASYQRMTDGMEKIWDDLYEEGQIYLGEWHSHPNGSASYSYVDKQAMINIANCDKVVIDHPIMLIISISTTKVREIKAYYCRKDKLIEYEPHRD